MKNKEKYFNEILEAFINKKECAFKKFNIYKRDSCIGISCDECHEMTRQWLEKEYKEHIKLTQFEYDLIMKCYEVANKNDIFNQWWILEGMKEKGYFKEVNPEMKISEIAKNCEIID